MLWVYFIVALGLVGIMVETWISYRKASEALVEDRERVRRGIQQHEAATADLAQKRGDLEASITELRRQREQFTGEAELKRQEFEELLGQWRLHNPGDPFDTDPGRIR